MGLVDAVGRLRDGGPEPAARAAKGAVRSVGHRPRVLPVHVRGGVLMRGVRHRLRVRPLRLRLRACAACACAAWAAYPRLAESAAAAAAVDASGVAAADRCLPSMSVDADL